MYLIASLITTSLDVAGLLFTIGSIQRNMDNSFSTNRLLTSRLLDELFFENLLILFASLFVYIVQSGPLEEVKKKFRKSHRTFTDTNSGQKSLFFFCKKIYLVFKTFGSTVHRLLNQIWFCPVALYTVLVGWY